MCTAVSFLTENHYFGRNLDYEHTFGEAVTVTPRNFELKFRNCSDLKTHYAIIGMAAVSQGYPLYFDATNEKGLSMAGLNFPEYATYKPYTECKNNIAPFEFIPWVLAQCANMAECTRLLENVNLENTDFSDDLPVSPLHWMISDREKDITIEPTADGLRIYENPVGVLTNSPEIDMHLFNLNNYISLSTKAPKNTFSEKLDLKVYSRGMGAMGLPGYLSSASRFVKAAFTKSNSVCAASESASVSQFFHILYSVYQQRGCVEVKDGLYEMTNYSSCCNTDRGIYYYTTYENSTIYAVDMYKEKLDSSDLAVYPLAKTQNILLQN